MKDLTEAEDIVQLIVGFNLAERRQKLRIGVEQVCGGVGVSAETLLAFEAGRRRPDAKTLLALAEMLDVAPQYFFSIPKFLDAGRRAQLRSARAEAGDSDGGDAMAVTRAFARMKNLAGRNVVSDMAQTISELDADRRP